MSSGGFGVVVGVFAAIVFFAWVCLIESCKKAKKKRKKRTKTEEESRPAENEAANPLKRDSNMSKIPVWLINSVMVLKQAACRPHRC